MSTMEIRRQAIAELETPGRTCTPDMLVEAARSPQHPLHSEFCWDGDEAIQKLAVQTAREIIRSVRVEILKGEVRVVTALYVRNPSVPAHTQGYIATEKLKESPENSLASIELDISKLENAISALRAKALVLGVTEPLDVMLQQSDVLRAALGLKRSKPKHAA